MADIPAVTMAEDRLHRAHQAAAVAARDHARAIAYARRELAHALRVQEGPPEQQWMTPPTLTEEDRETIHAVALAVGIADNQRGTALQNVELIRQLPDNLAAALVENWGEKSALAWQCFELHHEGQIEQLRAQLQELTTAHECWTHSHPREGGVGGR